MVALEYVYVEQDADPARQISLHEICVVLLYLGQDVPLAGLVKLVLHPLDNLPHYKVLVYEYEEETLEEGVDV